MVTQIKTLIKRNGLIISIYLILFIIVINSVFMVFSRKGTIESLKMKEQVFTVNHGIEFMNKYVNLADLGLRGYIIEQDEKFLSPYIEAMASYQNNFDELRVALNQQGFDMSLFNQAEGAVDRYMKLVQQMVQMCASGNVDEAVRILKNDPGYDAWKVYSVFERAALDFENQRSEQANITYKNMVFRMVIAQSLLILIGIPILIMTALTIQKNRKVRVKLFDNISHSNKKYVFDSGKEEEAINDKLVIEGLIGNLKKTSGFINNITEGNYDIEWEGLTKENASLNKENIAGELATMRDQMKKVKAEDEIRIWITQGLSDFAEIVRANQNDFKVLAGKLINNLVKYLHVQQGGLFIVNTENEDDAHLELMGCYAYDRVKSMEKRIEFGQGLVGQVYLEKETVYMTEVPQEFVNITSGLGDARPDCILIVPLKLNDNIEGVIELASMRPLRKHEIEFVEKLGETIASAITTVRTAENTTILLGQSQQQAEEMRAQEEEMRQNMEELQATQEQIHRKNEEVEQLLKKATDNEEAMKAKNEIMASEKKTLVIETGILNTLMEITHDRITVKDTRNKYLKLSKSKLAGMEAQGIKDIFSKSDREMFGEEHYKKSFSIEQELMKTQKPILNIEEKIQLSENKSIWGLTSRVPFKDTNGAVLGTVVMTRDITKEKLYSEELENLKNKGASKS